MSLRTKLIRDRIALPSSAWRQPAATLAETNAERQACTNDAQVHCADQIP